MIYYFFLLSGFFLGELPVSDALHHLWPVGNVSIGYDVLEGREALYPPTPYCFPRGVLHPVLRYEGLQFNGDNYIDVLVGDKTEIKSQFTFAINLYPDKIQLNKTFFEYIASHNVSHGIVRIQLTTNGINVNIAIYVMGGETEHHFLPGLLMIKSWTYFVFTVHGDDRKVTFYKNGSEVTNLILLFHVSGISLSGRLRIGKSGTGSDGFHGSIACVHFEDRYTKPGKVNDYFQECDSKTGWLPVPGDLCQWGNSPRYAFALTEPNLGYEFKTDRNLTIKQPSCPRFVKGPSTLTQNALKFDGSQIIDIGIPSNILNSYVSQAFFVYVESNWSGTILDYLAQDVDSPHRMTLSVSSSKLLVLTIRSRPDDLVCGEASVPVITSNWTIVVTEYKPHVGELVLFQGDTNTTATSCIISTNNNTGSGFLRIGGSLDDVDHDFRGRLTCLLFFDTKMDGKTSMLQIMSENCIYLQTEERNCSITRQSSYYRLQAKNQKPEDDSFPMVTVVVRKSLHCAKLCAQTLHCHSFLTERLSVEKVRCRIFDFIEKNNFTSADGYKYYILYWY